MDIAPARLAVEFQNVTDGRQELNEFELDTLASSRLFAGMSRERLREWLKPNGEVNLRTGAVLLELGQRNATIYLLVSGRLAIYLDEDGKIPIAHVEPGECVGEISIIDDEAASASVVAVEASRLLVTNPDHLWQMMREEHTVALNLMQILAERIRRNNTAVLESFRQQAKLNMISGVDLMTGLHNRRWLNDVFVRQIDRCSRQGHPVCLAMLDIDRFKIVNDTFGHQAGDQVLAHVARVMSAQFRPSDSLVRYGGDEFAVLFPETSLQAAVAALERFRLAVEQTQTSVALRTTVKVRISAGVCAWCDGWSLDDLVQRADRALYRAKESGRNCVLVAEQH
jgi:diguanylate cyclase (GGDEF)-like protein